MGLFNASTQQTGMIGNDLPKNRFVGPNGEEYFLQIDPVTKKTQVWNEEWGSDKNVGTFDEKGNFIPNKNWWGGARKNEIEYFNSPEGRLAVKNQSEVVMKNEDGRINQAQPPKSLTKTEQKDLLNKNAAAINEGVSEEDIKLNSEREANAKRAAMGGKAMGRKRYGHYCYPITLRRGQQDRLKISVIEFKPKGMTGGGFSDRNSRIVGSGNKTQHTELELGMSRIGGGRRGFLGRTAIGSVVLPVNNVKDQNKTAWGESSLNAGQIAMANIALAGLTRGVQAMAGETNKTLKELNDADKKATKDAVAQYFVNQATGVSGILARTSGSVINPNMELIFKGPQLREFQFTYQLSARDGKESQDIKKIIRMFKQSMAPQRSDSLLFLKAPNTYRLEYLSSGRSSSHNYLPKIKECALTSFDVNYTPNGTYMTYEDSSMIQYELQFSFKELEPSYNSDYTQLDGDSDRSIGY